MTTRRQHDQAPAGDRGHPLRTAASLLVAGLALLCGVFASSASAAVPGLQLVTRTSVTDSASSKAVTAHCPIPKLLLGAGGEVTGGLGQVVINRLAPNPKATHARVVAYEDDTGTPAAWSVTAYAICADAIPGHQLITASTVSNSVTGEIATADCPAGKNLVGSGGQLAGANGEVVMDDLAVDAALTRVTVRGFEDENGTTANWEVGAHAICANPLPGLQRIVATGLSNSLTGSGATAFCPAGKRLVGTGGELTAALGQVTMDDVRPSPGLTSVTITGFEDGSGTAASWIADAYGICATA